MNDNLSLTSAEVNGLLPDGTYNWLEILGATTNSLCLQPGGVCAPDEFSPVNGEEWTLALISDSNWFSDGSMIPDTLPSNLTQLIVGIDIDQQGNEIGTVFASVNTSPVSSVPEPATVWLLGSGLLGLLFVVHGKKLTPHFIRTGQVHRRTIKEV